VSERLTPERLRYIKALEFSALDDNLTMLLECAGQRARV